MKEEEISKEKKKIDQLTQVEACRIWRFSPPGHPYFQFGNPLRLYFEARFKQLGGFTPSISKEIGFD